MKKAPNCLAQTIASKNTFATPWLLQRLTHSKANSFLDVIVIRLHLPIARYAYKFP